jgi:hypothetical protein
MNMLRLDSHRYRAVAATVVVIFCVCAVALARIRGGAQKPSAHIIGRMLYVSPKGTSTADGSELHPVDLASALSANGPVGAGDTVWLRGGTYKGTFVSELRGTEAARILVRQYPGERATIDSAPSLEPALFVKGGWTTYWGFEVTNSDPARVITETGSHPATIHRGIGLDVHGPHTRFVNLVVHDLAGGFGIWTDAEEAEAYGNIVYHNGWEADDRAHGHGIYTQNRLGTRRLTDNIVFSQFSHGIHAYGSGAAHLDHITLSGNVVFNNGELDATYFDRNILLGGERVAADPFVENNFTYYSPGRRHGGENNFGYNAGCTNLVARDNYFAGQVRGGVPLKLLDNCRGTMTGNVFYGLMEQRIGRTYPDNTYVNERPTGQQVFIRRNKYDSSRSHVIVYNWDRLPELTLDLSAALLEPNMGYELRDAQNVFGPAVASGTFGNGRVKVPLRGLTVESPVGNVAPPAHTAPEFAVFILIGTPRAGWSSHLTDVVAGGLQKAWRSLVTVASY